MKYDFSDGLILGFIAAMIVFISCYVSYQEGIESGKDLCIAHPDQCKHMLSLGEMLDGKKQ